jgi:uncharacterized protein (DUF1330 family)
MTVYVIANVKFTKEELYRRYQARFFDVFKQFKGRLLVADEAPKVLDGAFPHDKVVVMQFPDRARRRVSPRQGRGDAVSGSGGSGAFPVLSCLRGYLKGPYCRSERRLGACARTGRCRIGRRIWHRSAACRAWRRAGTGTILSNGCS